MAIIKGMHGVCIEVAVDGVALQEYDDDEDAELDSVAKYIPATTGACFEIRWRFDKTFEHIQHPIRLGIKLDGKYAASTIILAAEMPTTTRTSNRIEGRRSKVGNDWFKEKFSFSGLVVDDTMARPSHDAAAAATLGLISVSLRRLKKVSPEPFVPSYGANFDTISKVSEKELKGRALSHTVQLAEAEPMKAITIYKIEYLDESPFATFNFKYRSPKALKDLYIIPRSPSPLPLEDRPLQTLSQAELVELARRQKQQLERSAAVKVKREGMRSVKRERDGNDDSELSVIDTRPRKAARNSQGNDVELVDLT